MEHPRIQPETPRYAIAQQIRAHLPRHARPPVSDGERQLVAIYRLLPPAEQTDLLRQAIALVSQHAEVA